MNILKLLLIFILFVINLSLLTAGNVTMKVNSNNIVKGEEVVVDITANGQDIVFPTINDIGSYPVSTPQLSKKSGASYMNGKISSFQQETLRFSFYPESDVTIPPFKVKIDGKTVQTKSTKIYISSEKNKNNQGDYKLDMVSSKDKVYVGEPFVLQVVFYEPRNSNVAQAQYVAPKFEGFFVKADKNEKLKQTSSGTAHVFDYILTPQKAGTFTITAPQIKIGITTFSGARDPWGFFNNEVHWRNIRGDSKSISVKPLPSHVDLVGSFITKTAVDIQNAKANEPVSYTLTIQGKGALDDMEEPKFDLNDVTVYSDDAQISTEVKDGEIVSSWKKIYTFIADHDFVIPTIKKMVFNPKTGKSQEIIAKSFDIKVKGKTKIQATQSKTTPKLPTTPKTKNGAVKQYAATKVKNSKDNNRSLLEDIDYYKKKEKEDIKSRWPLWALFVSFFTGIILTLVFSKLLSKVAPRQKKNNKRKYTTKEALDILYPHTNDSPEIEEMVRELYKAKNDNGVVIDKENLNKLINQILE